MKQDQVNDNQIEYSIHATRFYIILSIVAIMIMIIAAFVTYGNQTKEVHVVFEKEVNSANQDKSKENSIDVGADLSKVPSDKALEDILNDNMPNVCDDCDEDEPLDCLRKFAITPILVQKPPHQNHLFIELATGKNQKEKFVVIIDLNNENQVLNAGGKIDEDRCKDVARDKFAEDAILTEGADPKTSGYVNTKPVD